MSSRLLSAGGRVVRTQVLSSRSFHSSAPRFSEAAAQATIPARRPVGAFRGGLFGFLLGSTAAGSAVYSYLLKEYKASNDLLTEDIYALQTAVQRIGTYLQALEEHMDALERKKK